MRNPVREEFMVPAHPEFIEGVPVWTLGGTVQEVIDRIERGDPTKGWEGDPRLTVRYNRETDQWLILRLERDGRYLCVAAKPPGSPLDDRAIDMLVKYDTRRGYSAGRDIHEHNTKLNEDKEQQAADHQAEMLQRVHFEARKEGIDLA